MQSLALPSRRTLRVPGPAPLAAECAARLVNDGWRFRCLPAQDASGTWVLDVERPAVPPDGPARRAPAG